MLIFISRIRRQKKKEKRKKERIKSRLGFFVFPVGEKELNKDRERNRKTENIVLT